MSIQLKLGGHSFSATDISDDMITSSESVECVVLTAKTTLVPSEVFDAESTARYMEINGMPCNQNETPIFSDVSAQVIAIMAVDKTCVQILNEHLGGRATFTTPLLSERVHQERHIWLFRSEDLLYIKVYDADLRLAEVVAALKDEDVLWYIDELSKQMDIKNHTIYIKGNRRQETRKLLGRYFRHTVCE